MSTLSSRLIALLAALFFCIAALTATSWVTTGNQSEALGRLYTENVVPLRDLKIISDRYAVDVVDAAHKARAGSFTMEKSNQVMRAALEEIGKLWNRYQAQVTDKEEANKAKTTAALLADAHKATETLISLTAGGDKAKLVAYIEGGMYPAIDPATEAVGQLIDLQLVRAEATRNEAQRVGAISNLALTAMAGIALIFAAVGCLYVMRGIARPLRQSIAAMSSLATITRDTSETALDRLALVTPKETRRADEIGDIQRALTTLCEAEGERRRLVAEALAAEAARLERAGRIEALIRQFDESAQATLREVGISAESLLSASDRMLNVSRTTSEQAGVVAAATHEAAESAKSLTSVGDELAMSIAEISRQAEQSSAFASEAAVKARNTDTTVGKLNEAGRSIVEVVSLIKTIASQTNLLALNATIEAARAGEAGRGFAVVAAEVKALASQTTRATEVISDQVLAIQEAAAESIEAIQDITQMIEQINQVASSIAVAVTEQSQATTGIAENVMQVARGSEHAAESITVVHEAARETGDSANLVRGASGTLKEQSDRLRADVVRFLKAVQAA